MKQENIVRSSIPCSLLYYGLSLIKKKNIKPEELMIL